jgi:hexosaminidase
VPLEKVYGYDPTGALPADAARHVLGAQAQLWTEYMPDSRLVEYMAFPRLSALAETTWTPAERKDYNDFLVRLPDHLARLQALDVNYRKPR